MGELYLFNILIFVLMLLSSEEQAGETWGTWNRLKECRTDQFFAGIRKDQGFEYCLIICVTFPTFMVAAVLDDYCELSQLFLIRLKTVKV